MEGYAKIRNIILIAILLVVAITACSKSPETARKELGQMNIDYTEDNFIKYIERGDRVVVDLFLTAGMSPNLRGKDSGFYVLSTAASYGHDEIVKLLIAKGADVNAERQGWLDTFNECGYKRENLGTVKILLNKGADINAKDYRWEILERPLILAVSKKRI